ncbi:MAG: hypothetical protein LBU61_03325, partial [Coriobacteriales bacterium]|nr:hypothetical protein [Coriobacteriales bacterium]
MRVIVLGGFLGSGKTTILLQLARRIVDKYQPSKEYPVVVIENEVGEISIDSELMGAFQVTELIAGCICCTLSSDLTKSVITITETYDPEFIIIEC